MESITKYKASDNSEHLSPEDVILHEKKLKEKRARLDLIYSIGVIMSNSNTFCKDLLEHDSTGLDRFERSFSRGFNYHELERRRQKNTETVKRILEAIFNELTENDIRRLCAELEKYHKVLTSKEDLVYKQVKQNEVTKNYQFKKRQW